MIKQKYFPYNEASSTLYLLIKCKARTYCCYQGKVAASQGYSTCLSSTDDRVQNLCLRLADNKSAVQRLLIYKDGFLHAYTGTYPNKFSLHVPQYVHNWPHVNQSSLVSHVTPMTDLHHMRIIIITPYLKKMQTFLIHMNSHI